MEWSENIEEALEPGAVRVDIRRGVSDTQRVITIEGQGLAPAGEDA